MKRPSLAFLASGAAVTLCAVVALANTIVVPSPAPTPPSERASDVADRRPVRPLALETKRVTVDAVIRNQVASTTLKQEVHNPTRRPLEAEFLFPVPKDASLDSFTMSINGVDTPAELLSAEKAREIYERIVRQMKDPALLEFIGQGVYRARVFPIAPDETKRITLQYTQVLRADTGSVEYAAPLALHASRHPSAATAVAARVRIESDAPIGAIYSPTHDVDVARPEKGVAIASFETTDAGAADSFKLHYATEVDSNAPIGLSLLTFRPDEKEAGHFLLIATPTTPDDAAENVAEKDIVFVLDTSGSMAGEKIEQAKGALRFCLNSLNPGDRFEVARFSTEPERLFDGLSENTKETRRKALDFVETFRASGGTAINDALLAALEPLGARTKKARPYVVVFLTDGLPTVGETNKDVILANLSKRLAGGEAARVFCFGVGDDVNTHLLDEIATRTRAVSQYVAPQEDIEIKVSRFYGKISDPALSSIELAFENQGGADVRTMTVHPRALPDLFKGDQLIVLGRYEGSGDVTVRLSGMLGEKEAVFERAATFAGSASRHEFIAPLWATRRIGFLLDEIRLNGANQELQEEVATLARRYGIVTPYTSYLILDDEQRRGVPLAQQTLRGREVEEAARDFSPRELGQRSTGARGVDAARSIGEMRRARSAPAAEHASRSSYSRDAVGMRAQVATRYVQGRAFFQSGDTWIDSQVQSAPKDASRRRVAFGSEAYFELLEEHPQAAAWLSVASNVELVLGGEVVEVYDAE